MNKGPVLKESKRQVKGLTQLRTQDHNPKARLILR